ncbi:MAG: hypothetical protein H0X47_19070 [Nitrospirales bacterium]|nr:hypothetical protein [Nitrospirales bacterium]
MTWGSFGVNSDAVIFRESMAPVTIAPQEQAKDVSEAMTIKVTPGHVDLESQDLA